MRKLLLGLGLSLIASGFVPAMAQEILVEANTTTAQATNSNPCDGPKTPFWEGFCE